MQDMMRYDSWYIKWTMAEKYVNIYIGVDPASTLGQRNDYSVIMVIGVTSGLITMLLNTARASPTYGRRQDI